MSKTLPSSGANAVKMILKEKALFHCHLKNTMEGQDDITYVFDVEYGTYIGTFNFRMKEDVFASATLNLMTLKKVITLDNDANLLKLCEYVYAKEIKK